VRARPASPRVLLAVVAGLAIVGLALLLMLRAREAGPQAGVLLGADGPLPAPHFRDDGAAAEAPMPAPVSARPEPLAAAAEPAGQAADDGSFYSGPRRSISGRVLRASDGTPLEGARVLLHDIRTVNARGESVAFQLSLLDADGDGNVEFSAPSLSLSSQPQPVETDAQGRFELRDVPLDIVELWVASDDAWPERRTAYSLPAPAGDLTQTADITGLELVFDSGFRLRARVLDARGTPIAGATVGLGPMEPAVTDLAGNCEFRDVAPERTAEALASDGFDFGTTAVAVYAEAPWHQRGTNYVGTPADPTAVLVTEFRLEGSGALQGIVSSAAGEPMESVEVRLLALMTGEPGTLTPDHLHAQTGADGAYRLDHVPEGNYLVLVGEQRSGLAGFMGAAEGGQISMFVELVGGGEGSTFRLLGERPRETAERLFPDVLIEAGRVTHLDVVLEAGATIEGDVTNADGVPIMGVTVTLERVLRWPAGSGGAPGESVHASTEDSVATDDAGHFRFEQVAAGEKRLSAGDSEQHFVPQTHTLFVSGTALQQVDFALQAALVARGRVIDPAGAPIEGAAVALTPMAGSTAALCPNGEASTDADGWFEVRGLAPVEYRVSITRPDRADIVDALVPGQPPRTWVMAQLP
jgi:hypothetical protein